MTTAGTKSTLNQGQSYQLCRWMDEHRDGLDGASLTKDEVARKAQKDLKFMVTWSNVRSALKTLDIKLATERGPVDEKGTIRVRVERLERGFERLCRKLGTDPADLLDDPEDDEEPGA